MVSKVQEYITKAKHCIKEREYFDFLENIITAKLLAKDDDKALTEVLVNYAIGLYSFQEYIKAFELIKEVLESRNITDEDRIGLIQKKANIFCRLGLFDKAIAIFEDLSKEESRKARFKGISNLGWVYLCMHLEEANKDHVLKSIDYTQQAMEIVDEDNVQVRSELYINLGIAYSYLEDYEKALEIYLEAEKISKEDLRIINSIAITYINISEFDLASSYLKSAETLATKRKEVYQLAWSNFNKAKLAQKKFSDYMKAKDYMIVAFDNLVQVNAYAEACKCLDEILDLDHIVNKESISSLGKKLKNKFSKDFKSNINKLELN